MATWTKAKLASRILEALGVVGESQTATAEQSARTQEVIDSVYDRLRPSGLVPFATSAVPEWAQQGFLKVIAADVAPRFGYAGARLAERVQLARVGKTELAEGVAGNAPPIPIKSDFY